MEDYSANGSEPAVHWVVYDIPSTAERVAENQPKQAKLVNGALQGLNLRNEAGFIGPKRSVSGPRRAISSTGRQPSK